MSSTKYQISVRKYADNPGNNQHFVIEGLKSDNWDYTIVQSLGEGEANDTADSVVTDLFRGLYDELQVNEALHDGDEFEFPGGRVNMYLGWNDSLGVIDIPPVKFRVDGVHVVRVLD